MHAPLITGWVTPLAGEGENDGPINAPTWLRPSTVSIEGNFVEWDRPSRPTTLSMTTLDDFTQLVDGPPSMVKGYIKKWGVLGICLRHKRPHALAPWPTRLTDDGRCTVDDRPLRGPTPPADGMYRETLDAYRSYAKQALTMIQIADLIRRRIASGRDMRPPRAVAPLLDGDGHPVGKRQAEVGYFPARDARIDEVAVPRQMWETLYPLTQFRLNEMLVHGEDTPRPPELGLEQTLLEQAIQAWLNIGQVEVRWTWPSDRANPQLEVGASHLFGGLAYALAMKTTRLARLYVCEDCGKPFTPKSRKAVVRWCKDCRDGAAHREQERRRRARRRAERDGTVRR